jgi:hypothetical protein
VALDLGLAGGDGRTSSVEVRVSFDDDLSGGYYWFLHPLFERLALSTGQYIDLYGDAEFRPENLEPLENVLLEARQMVLARPKRWSVHVGTQTHPTKRELFKEVERSTFLALIDRLMDLVRESRTTGRSIICLGD